MVIRRFEDMLKARGFSNEKHSSAFALITFEYTINTSVSAATQESQQMCKNSIFSEFLLNILDYATSRSFNIEQTSTLMSICFFIFVESLERKKT
jgi:hypothetical protein